MITSERMAAVDENAAALGVPRKQLMESSGNAVAAAVRERTEPGDSVAIVGGRGNNGGDGFVAARFLADRDVTTLLLGRPATIATEIARENWQALQRSEADAREVRDATALREGPAADAIADADVLVDAMLGTGVSGALREPAATAAEQVNDASAPVVAVDVPSGIDADTGEVAGASSGEAADTDATDATAADTDADATDATATDATDADAESAGFAVDADHVVTFHDETPGLAELDATVAVADIGIPRAAELFVERGDLLALGRSPDAHKGDHGHVLVVGGGPYTGAPALAAQAAIRAGADLATVACPAAVADRVQGYSENLLVEALPGGQLQPGHVDRLLELAASRDATILGPGLGRADGTMDAAREFLASVDGTVVVDADPLRVVPDVETDATLLCTPHRGELAAMGGPEAADWRERAEAVAAFAAELDATLLVKGPYDVVTDGDATRVNRTGNPGMTVGGTGDVLAGICGALACTLSPLQAGAIGAHVNGRAGDAVVDESGYGLVATDLLQRIPRSMWGEDGA